MPEVPKFLLTSVYPKKLCHGELFVMWIPGPGEKSSVVGICGSCQDSFRAEDFALDISREATVLLEQCRSCV